MPLGPDHFWTYLPKLGQDWEYCDRCKMARDRRTKRMVPIEKALKETKVYTYY